MCDTTSSCYMLCSIRHSSFNKTSITSLEFPETIFERYIRHWLVHATSSKNICSTPTIPSESSPTHPYLTHGTLERPKMIWSTTTSKTEQGRHERRMTHTEKDHWDKDQTLPQNTSIHSTVKALPCPDMSICVDSLSTSRVYKHKMSSAHWKSIVLIQTNVMSMAHSREDCPKASQRIFSCKTVFVEACSNAQATPLNPRDGSASNTSNQNWHK